MHVAALLATLVVAWSGPGADPRLATAPPRPDLSAAAAFVPPHAHPVALHRVPRTGAIPAQLLVAWEADPPGGGDFTGLSVWERAGRRSWRRIYRVRRPPNVPRVGVELADVTRDGHLDALLLMSGGSAHGCGPRRLLALERGRARSIWATDDVCDPAPRLHGHVLVVDEPEGIEDSVCCPSFHRHRVLRWDGTRMRVVLQQWIPICVLGGPYCGSSASRRPVRVALHDVRWWDSRRGVATARDLNRAHLELGVATENGGRTWTPVFSTFLHLRAPRLDARGRALLVGERCASRCTPAWSFHAQAFGRYWTDSKAGR
jgi:hypothetical protein